MNDWNERLRRLFGGGRGGVQPGVYAVGLGVVLLLWVVSGVFVVQTSEVAVVTRFGAFDRTVGPGLQVRLPAPFENHQRVQVTTLQQTIIGGAQGNDSPEESQMITSDDAIIDVDFAVQWRIDDPVKYLFNVREPAETVKAVAEAAMREVIGQTTSVDVLTGQRGRTQLRAAEVMQRVLNSYDAGVSVVEVQLLNVNPPAPVVPAFQSLQQASQDAQALVNQGNTYRNRVINEAQGDAARITAAAEGYKQQVVLVAQGDAARFNQLYEQYRGNPSVTRQRMYLETMERILRRVNKVVIDSRGATAPIILPPDVFRARTPDPQAPAPQAPQPQQPAQQGARQ